MVSPIFPGVGTQSRVAQVIQADNELRLRQEALNRQSGQNLLETGVQTGFGVNQAIQQVLDRQAAEREAAATRTAALTEISRTGQERRLTQGQLASLGRKEAERVEGVTERELLRQERRVAPGGEEFLLERLRNEERDAAAERLANIRIRGQLEGGPVAAARVAIEDRPGRLREEEESQRRTAQIAVDFARDPIKFLEEELKQILTTVQKLKESGRLDEAETVRTTDIPQLLDLYEQQLQADPTNRSPSLDLFLEQRRERERTAGVAADAAAADQTLEDAAARASRLRQQDQLPFFVPQGVPGFGPGRPF